VTPAAAGLLAAAVLLHACGAGAETRREPERAPPGQRELEQQAVAFLGTALNDPHAYGFLADLARVAPHRLTGSAGAERAIAWAEATMRRIGLDGIRQQAFAAPCWERGEAAASVVEPAAERLDVLALGGSIGTPPDGITAELRIVRGFEQLAALGDDARGRIVLFNRPMPQVLANAFEGYGSAVPQRTNGAIEAGKAGAVAALVRSVTTSLDDFPHTGAMRYDDEVPPIPSAAISTLDAERLVELQRRHGRVVVRLQLGCRTLPDRPSANVIGEIRGSERPHEIVLLGAHLDAWDVGEGAHDDGAGCAHLLEAMRILRAHDLRPRRTLRAVLFMNEENGLRGAHAYADAVRALGEPHVAAIETDRGGFRPIGFTTTLPEPRIAELRPLLAAFQRLGADPPLVAGGGGADIAPLGALGVPLFGLLTDSRRYFDYHHSDRDRIDTVQPQDLELGAAVLAYFAWALGERL
jgi:hypothetical protein